MKLQAFLYACCLSCLLHGFASCVQENGGETTDPLPEIPRTAKTTGRGGAESFEEKVANYESKERLFWQKPDLVIDRLGDISEKTIADIGAGSGYFARRLAHKAQRVIAIDIDQQFIDFMDSIKVVELPTEYQDNFETRLAYPDDPNLEPNEADIVLIVNTYMLIQDRVAYLRLLKEGIRPGGKLVIVDYKKKRIPLPAPPQSIRLPLFQVENELEEAGYELLEADDTSLDYQYIVMVGV